MNGSDVESRVVVLVPSISADRLAHAGRWLDRMRQSGFDTLVVANGASAAAAARRLSLPFVDTRGNPGFARSILAALADQEPWEWVLLMNDDVEVGADSVDAVRDALDEAGRRGSGVVFFGAEPDRAIPRAAGVFANLSLLEAIRGRLARRPRRDAEGTYRSFSAVAISADAWHLVGGLDRRYVFCYEDADFIRRYRNLGGREPLRVAAAIAHHKSASTGQHIAGVLPAIAYSACTYLRAIGVGPARAEAVVVLALLTRVLLVPFAAARVGSHLRGISGGIRCVLRRREPALPAYDEL